MSKKAKQEATEKPLPKMHREFRADSTRLHADAHVGIGYFDGQDYERMFLGGKTYVKPLAEELPERFVKDSDTCEYTEAYRQAYKAVDERIARDNDKLMTDIGNAIHKLDMEVRRLMHRAGYMIKERG